MTGNFGANINRNLLAADGINPDLPAEEKQVLVPKQEIKDEVLYFNPGSAGPRRFRLPITVGRLEIVDGKVSGKVVEIL